MSFGPATLGVRIETFAPAASEPEQPEMLVLTAAMARGGEAAFRQFHQLYFGRLLRYLIVITKGQEEVAREALQLTYVRVARRVRKFDSETALWNWLAMLARNCAVDEIRKQNRRDHLLARFFHEQADVVALNGADVDGQVADYLQAGLTALPADERALLERKYFDGATVRELADWRQMSEKAMESHLLRIRRKLKAIIFERMQNETKL